MDCKFQFYISYRETPGNLLLNLVLISWSFFPVYSKKFIFLFPIIIPSESHAIALEVSEILKAYPNSIVKPKHKSQDKYFNSFENSFCVLPSGEIMIGENSGILKTEDITRKEIRVVIDQKESIETMIFNKNLNSLLIGEKNGIVSQYGRNPSGNFKKQKEYRNVEVGRILASDWSGNFAVMGGSRGVIILIDMNRKLVIEKRIRTAIQWVCSLQFCRVSQKEMYLAVGGGYGKNYSGFKTDLFDVSDLFSLNKQRNFKPIKNELTK